MSNEDLDREIANEMSEFAHSGETKIIPALCERGILLPRWRVREAIVRVDPISRVNRWGQRIVHHPYCVPHSNLFVAHRHKYEAKTLVIVYSWLC